MYEDKIFRSWYYSMYGYICLSAFSNMEIQLKFGYTNGDLQIRIYHNNTYSEWRSI